MTESAGEKTMVVVGVSGFVSGIAIATGGSEAVVAAGPVGGVGSLVDVGSRRDVEVEGVASGDGRGGVVDEGSPEGDASGEGVG